MIHLNAVITVPSPIRSYFVQCHKNNNKEVTCGSSYKKKLEAAFDKLNMVLSKKYHSIIYVNAAILDMEEVDPMIARAISNWVVDTFGGVYSKNLPFPAVRVLAGGNTRRSHYQNTRITFKGNAEHKELAKKFFPCFDATEEKIS